MADVLSSEERRALSHPYLAASAASGRRGIVVPEPASFPSVSQLDAQGSAALIGGMERWLEGVARDLGRLLRAPCAAGPVAAEPLAPLPPRQESDPAAALRATEEIRFRARVLPDHPLLLSMPQAFAVSLSERLFGAPLLPRQSRPLTGAEATLLREMVSGWLGLAQTAWKAEAGRAAPLPEAPAKELRLQLIEARGRPVAAERLPTPPRDAAGVGPTTLTEPAATWTRLTGELLCGGVAGRLDVAMPPETVDLLLGRSRKASADAGSPANLVRRLGRVPIELRALLGEAQIGLDRIGRLKVGDVIPLNRRVHAPIDLLINEQPVFRARIGLAGQQIAVELVGDETEEEQRI